MLKLVGGTSVQEGELNREAIDEEKEQFFGILNDTVADVISGMSAGTIDNVLIIYTNREGELECHSYTQGILECIGILEAAKIQCIASV